MKAAVSLFPNPSKLLIAGDSAGAFAVPALSGIIADEFYPDCRDITLFSDSAQLLYKDWRQTARDIWKADKRFFEPLHTDNIFLDWYGELLSTRPDRFRCLYASTTHDYLLSTFLNDVMNKSYSTDGAVQGLFYRQLQEMVRHADIRTYEARRNGRGQISGGEFDSSDARSEDIMCELGMNLQPRLLDSLTGLPGMQFFRTQAHDMLESTVDSTRKPVIIYFNITNFRIRHYNKLSNLITNIISITISNGFITNHNL